MGFGKKKKTLKIVEAEADEEEVVEEEEVQEEPEQLTPKEKPRKEVTAQEILINHEQRIVQLEAAFYRLKGI